MQNRFVSAEFKNEANNERYHYTTISVCKILEIDTSLQKHCRNVFRERKDSVVVHDEVMRKSKCFHRNTNHVHTHTHTYWTQMSALCVCVYIVASDMLPRVCLLFYANERDLQAYFHTNDKTLNWGIIYTFSFSYSDFIFINREKDEENERGAAFYFQIFF